jgi:hypothetical protein
MTTIDGGSIVQSGGSHTKHTMLEFIIIEIGMHITQLVHPFRKGWKKFSDKFTYE